MSYVEDVTFVGAMLRGGDWEVGLRIARNVDPTGKGGGAPDHRRELAGGRVSLTQFANDAKSKGYSIDRATVAKYLAAWEWAAEAGWVDPAAELNPDDIYDFSGFPVDERDVGGDWVEGCWKSFYEMACMNPPPWNPQNKPLDGNYGGGRAERAATKPPTKETITDAIKSDAAMELAAREAIEHKDAERALEKAKRQSGSTKQESSPIDRLVALEIMFQRAKRALQDALSEVVRLPAGDDLREVVALSVDELRKYIDAIDHAGQGDSLDAELQQLLAGGV